MKAPSTPRAWAAQLTGMLNQVLGADRFPVKVAEIARDWTAQRFRDDPIVQVKGADLPGFEGALVCSDFGCHGWVTDWGRFCPDFVRSREFHACVWSCRTRR